jgi:hypothetical protein
MNDNRYSDFFVSHFERKSSPLEGEGALVTVLAPGSLQHIHFTETVSQAALSFSQAFLA